MRLSIFLPVAVLIASAPAFADDATPAKQEAKTVDPNKKVCRRIDVTGSMVPHRECRTAAEWSAIDAQNNRAATNALDGRHSGSGDH